MKKFLTLFLASMFILSATACGEIKTDDSSSNGGGNAEVQDVTIIMSSTEISAKNDEEKSISKMSRKEREEMIVRLTAEMKAAAKILEFEHAAYLRDKIEKLKSLK